MQFSCGQCSTRYAVPDDKVRGKRIRTKCRKCGAEIVVDGASLGGDAPPSSAAPAAPAAVAAAPVGAPYRPTPHAGTVAPGRTEDPWTVAISRSDQRKMVTSEVVEAYAAGTITDTTLVWKQGMQKWQPPFDIPAIALALLARGLEPKPKVTDQRAKTVPPPPDASPASDWDDEATRVFDAAVTEDLIVSRPPMAPAHKPVARAPVAPKTAAPPPKPAASAAAPPKPAAQPPAAGSSADWDDEDEATKMFAPDRALLGRRLPKASAKPKPPEKTDKLAPTTAPKVAPPGSLRSRPPPVPPKRSKPPAAPSVRPPAPSASTPTKDVGDATDQKPQVTTVRPPPGQEIEDPFGFEDEATAVITADRAKALLEEQLGEADKFKPPLIDETPMAFGTDTESPMARKSPSEKPGAADAGATARAKRDSLRSYDDLVEKGPTVVVAESERRSSRPPPPKTKTPLPPPPTPPKPAPPSGPSSSRDFGGIQHERTRVVRARKKPGGPLFWVALIVALGAAAVAGYYASRLLDATNTAEPERR